MNKKDISIKLFNKILKNPILPASGTYGYGYEFTKFYDVNILGAIVMKSVTLEPRYGNPLPRVAETYGGLINSIGLQNPGIEKALSWEFPLLRKYYSGPVIMNIAGFSVDEYIQLAKRIENHEVGKDILALELNVSCPNVKDGCITIGSDEKQLSRLIKEIKKVTKLPIIVKLSPNVTDIAKMAKIAEDSGADAISLINTLRATLLDSKTKEPILANKSGGLSGPAIKPMAIKMVIDVASVVKIPIIGIGGIKSVEDVKEFLSAGATCIQIGTANLINPYIMKDIIEKLEGEK